MAIKSSGQLSMRYDIVPEFGTSFVNASLRTHSSLAGFGTPDAMSEFYGFSRNRYYVSASGSGFLRTSAQATTVSGSTRYTMGLWIRNNAPSKRNQNLLAIGSDVYPSSRNYILMRYLASLNRIIVEVYRNGGRTLKRDYPLHDYPNAAYTGVTNSSRGWYSGQRGANTGGFNHIVCSVDLYQTTATNAIRLYWQGDELTYSVSNTNSSFFPASTITGRYISVGESLHQAAPSGGSWYGDIDNAFFYPGTLGNLTVDAITNLGLISPATYFANSALTPYGVYAFENNTFLEPGGAADYRLLRGGTISFPTY